MATKLKKSLRRESSEKIDGKEIMVELKEDQTIEMKVKGQRGAGESISIKDLYKLLYGVEETDEPEDSNDNPKKSKKGSVVINHGKSSKNFRKNPTLHQFLVDLRSQNAISNLDMETRAKFDTIIKRFMDSQK